MVLFLSVLFLRRLQLAWKPSLKAFLIGDRNLFFFTPDSLVEADAITPQSIDAFYQKSIPDQWQLLGYLTPEELPLQPGFAEIVTGGKPDPHEWIANVHLIGPEGPERRNLEIKVGSSGLEK